MWSGIFSCRKFYDNGAKRSQAANYANYANYKIKLNVYF
jgi:hypothetical protein